MKHETREKKKYISVTLVLLIMSVIVAVLVALTYFELHRYEDGIIDVCATQQDSYVQLVIDQFKGEQD